VGRFGSRAGVWDDWVCDVVKGEERLIFC
jgi:hypothetical protein